METIHLIDAFHSALNTGIFLILAFFFGMKRLELDPELRELTSKILAVTAVVNVGAFLIRMGPVVAGW